MTDHVVPAPDEKMLTLIKCWKCKTLYSTDKPIIRYKKNPGEPVETADNSMFTSMMFSYYGYEPCPICGCMTNTDECKISLWRYNLIKWWRERKYGDNEADDYSDGEAKLGGKELCHVMTMTTC